MNAPTGIINIRGREYQTVALRVQNFRELHPEHSLITALVERTADCVVMRAEIVTPDGRTIATGHAEEYRAMSQINKTSALENAETSAIGRALAAFGFAGTEFASANEVQNAIYQQNAPGGHSQDGAVGPRGTTDPKGWREPDSPLSTPTKLHRELTRLERELAGCGDSEMVYALTSSDEWREFVRIAESHAPHYLHGGDPAPDEFEGILNTAKRLVAEFDSADANARVAYLRDAG